jgi:hypothetical protein
MERSVVDDAEDRDLVAAGIDGQEIPAVSGELESTLRGDGGSGATGNEG